MFPIKSAEEAAAEILSAANEPVEEETDFSAPAAESPVPNEAEQLLQYDLFQIVEIAQFIERRYPLVQQAGALRDRYCRDLDAQLSRLSLIATEARGFLAFLMPRKTDDE